MKTLIETHTAVGYNDEKRDITLVEGKALKKDITAIVKERCNRYGVKPSKVRITRNEEQKDSYWI